MEQRVELQLFKERFKFSSGHFTIFSATEREDLHGHNFTVHVAIRCVMGQNGLAFDYAVYKRRIDEICGRLDEKFLLPLNSPHLKVVSEPPYQVALFADERIPFLERDVLLLPIRNTTLEELSNWILTELVKTNKQEEIGVESFAVCVSNGPGQSATSEWNR